MSEELKPCPWCGSNNVSDATTPTHYFIWCTECGTDGPRRKVYADAVAAWNTRAPELAAEVERLTAQNEALVGDLGRLYSYLEDVKTVDYSIARAELLAILDSALCAVAAAKDGGDD